jgi:lipopolysaccharide biosynthesis regulator YciM
LEWTKKAEQMAHAVSETAEKEMRFKIGDIACEYFNSGHFEESIETLNYLFENFEDFCHNSAHLHIQAANFFALKKFPQAMDFMLKAEQAELNNSLENEG